MSPASCAGLVVPALINFAVFIARPDPAPLIIVEEEGLLTATGYVGAPEACNGFGPGLAGQGFVAAADPADPGNVRFFATNANGMVYEHTSGLFAVMPEVGDPPSGRPLR